jgi:hypothetical protein
VKVWCGSIKDRIIRPFFVEATVTGGVFLDMSEQFVFPQAADLQPNIIYQQDGDPPTLEFPRSRNPHENLLCLRRLLWSDVFVVSS